MLDYNKTLELIKKAQNGDEESKSQLVIENSPLIKSVIRPYKNKGIEYEDLFQLGSVGFVKAINNFSESFNVKFSTYAVPMVAGEIKRFLRDDGSIKVSRAIKALNYKMNKYIQEYRNANNESPTLEQIAQEFGVDVQEVIFTLDSKRAPLSLDEKQDDQNSKSKSLMETIEDTNSADSLIENIMLRDALKNLSQRDKQIVLLRFFQDKTQSEIAKYLGVSQVQVSRLENKLLEKIKAKLE